MVQMNNEFSTHYRIRHLRSDPSLANKIGKEKNL